MAATTTVEKISCSMRLNNGTDANGKIKLVSVSLGTLSTTTFDDTKALNIATLLDPIMSKRVYDVRKTVISTIEE